jgi:hypothetical protein
MKWVTREKVKVDRVACPWLIRKFIDPQAEFLFVPTEQVMDVAKREGATPYDVKGVEFGHHGKECSFDAFVKKHGLKSDPAIVLLAKIVNGADTDNSLWNQPEAAGAECDRRRLSAPWVQRRSRVNRSGVDRLRCALWILSGDGATRQA